MCPWISRRKKDRHVCCRRVGKNCGTNLQSNCRMYAVKGARCVSLSYRYWRHSRKIRSAMVCRIVEMRLVPKSERKRVWIRLYHTTRAWSSRCLLMTVDDDDWLLKRSLRVSLALCNLHVRCVCNVWFVCFVWSQCGQRFRGNFEWLFYGCVVEILIQKEEGNLVKPNLILLTAVFKLLYNNKIIKEVQ